MNAGADDVEEMSEGERKKARKQAGIDTEEGG